MLQRFRKTVQISVLFIFFIILPLVNIYANALSAYQPANTGELFYFRENLYNPVVTDNSLVWKLVLIQDWVWGIFNLPPQTFAEWAEPFKGAPWTITLFGFTISDPLAVLSVIFASKEIPLFFIASALIPLLLALFLGRLFCGWICPMHTLLELNLKLRKILIKHSFNIRNHIFSRHWKVIFLGMGLLSVLMGIQVFPYLLPYVQLGRTSFYWFFYGTINFGLVLLIIIVLFELLLSERGWCRYFCPSGAFLQFVSKFSLLRINHHKESCLGECNRCSMTCELALHPRNGAGAECSKCGQCISGCPKGALSYTWQNFEIMQKNYPIFNKVLKKF